MRCGCKVDRVGGDATLWNTSSRLAVVVHVETTQCYTCPKSALPISDEKAWTHLQTWLFAVTLG